MQRATGAVAREVAQVERFGHNTLGGKRSIAVNRDGQRGARVELCVAVVPVGLFGARAPVHHRIDELEVARVGEQCHPDHASARREERPFGAVVILDVTGAAIKRGVALVPFELRQDHFVRAPHRVRQHIQAPAVRHAEHQVAHGRLAGEFDHEVEHRNHDVDAFNREAFGAEVRLVEESLHPLDRGQPRQDHVRLIGRERSAMHPRLDLFAQPEPLLVRCEMLHLVRDRSAVGLLQVRQRLGQRSAGYADAQDLGRDRRHDLGRQSEGGRIE